MQGIYINELGIHFVKTCFSLYWENIYFFGIFITGIFLFLTKKNIFKKYISVYTLFLFATIYNPILIYLVYAHFNQDEVYYRFFWLLPVNIVIAYMGTLCIEKTSGYPAKTGLAVIILCAVLLLGKSGINTTEFFKIPDNLFKVSDEALELSEYIHGNATDENPRIAISSDLLMIIRQYDASLLLTLDRDYVLCWLGSPLFQGLSANNNYTAQKEIMDVIYGGNVSNPDEFREALKSTSTQYIIFHKSVNIQDFLQIEGYQYVAETENYLVYRTMT